jgi:phage tail-like protein
VARRDDPHPAFRFEIRIDGIASGSFSECSGLASTAAVVEYREGGVNDRVHRFVDRVAPGRNVLRRGIVDRELCDWHAGIGSGKAAPRNGTIRVLDASGKRLVMEWRFERALPVAWAGPALDALESRVAVEQLELAPERLVRNV